MKLITALTWCIYITVIAGIMAAGISLHVNIINGVIKSSVKQECLK